MEYRPGHSLPSADDLYDRKDKFGSMMSQVVSSNDIVQEPERKTYPEPPPQHYSSGNTGSQTFKHRTERVMRAQYPHSHSTNETKLTGPARPVLRTWHHRYSRCIDTTASALLAGCSVLSSLGTALREVEPGDDGRVV